MTGETILFVLALIAWGFLVLLAILLLKLFFNAFGLWREL